MSKRRRAYRRSTGKGSFFGRYKLWIFLWIGVAVIVSGVSCGTYAIVSHAKETAAAEAAAKAAAEAVPKDVFYNTVFVGNSFVDTLQTYHFPTYADFICRVGLTVETAFTKDLVQQNVTAVEALKKQSYAKVFLVFGENELGWSYPEVFTEKYRELIAAVKAAMPKAEIYVVGILPVTEEASAKNQDNTNNERIGEYNEMLRSMAAEIGVAYVPPASKLMTESGALNPAGTTDGVHLNAEYNKIWIADLRKILEEK